jgi:hypothetical protein
MNENALHIEMGIPLLAHPKHTYSKIGGLTDSESEYSSDLEDRLDDLIQYSKQVESNSAKNPKSNQDSLPNLVIYATPQGRVVHLRKTQDPNFPGSQPADLPYQQSTPLDPSPSKQGQEIKDLCHEILMVRISKGPTGDPTERLNLDDYNPDDFDEYLSDNMETTPPVITEVQATTKEDSPSPPPVVTVTV